MQFRRIIWIPCLMAFNVNAYGFELPTADLIPLQQILSAKSIKDVERLDRNRESYAELWETCVQELQTSRIPAFCYEALAMAKTLQLPVDSATEAELDSLCESQATKTFDLEVLNHAKDRLRPSSRCMKYIREQQIVVLYKSGDSL